MTDEYVVLGLFTTGYSRGDVQMSHGEPREPDTRDASRPSEYHLDTVYADSPEDAISRACLNVVRNASASGGHPEWARRVSIARDADLFRAVRSDAGQKFSALGTPVDSEELTDFGMGSVLAPGDDIGNADRPEGSDALNPVDRHRDDREPRTDGGLNIHELSGVGEDTSVFCPHAGGRVGPEDGAADALTFCPYCGDESDSAEHRTHRDRAEVSCPNTTMSTWRYCPNCGEGLNPDVTDGGGLRSKYSVLKDGEPQSGCFVLKPEDDAAAREALYAYADATDNSELEADLNEWLDAMEPPETDGPTWKQDARENIRKWGEQDPDALILAMGEELGELSGNILAESEYPDGYRAEQGRDLIRRIRDLGDDIQEFLETVSEDDGGEPIPPEDRPNYLTPRDHTGSKLFRRYANDELDDLMALGFQFQWALDREDGEDEPEVRTDGGADRFPDPTVPVTLRDEHMASVHGTERCDGVRSDECVRDDPVLTRGEDEIHVITYGPGHSNPGRRVLCGECNDKTTALDIANHPDLAALYPDKLPELREQFPDILGGVEIDE